MDMDITVHLFYLHVIRDQTEYLFTTWLKQNVRISIFSCVFKQMPSTFELNIHYQKIYFNLK